MTTPRIEMEKERMRRQMKRQLENYKMYDRGGADHSCKPPWHVHDYQMHFSDDPNYPYDYSLICECGDTAPTMAEALARTHRSRREPHQIGIVATLLVAVVTALFALTIYVLR